MLAFVERGTVACASCRLRRPTSPFLTITPSTFYRTMAIVPLCPFIYLCTQMQQVNYDIL